MKPWLTTLLATIVGLASGLPSLALDLASAEGYFQLRDFHFHSGETLPELRLHYHTLGAVRRNSQGIATNAVLVLHGTGGSGSSLLVDSFAGELFRPGGLLDVENYFIILPDGIGHGKSSKPSDGLRASFPHYSYDDMVKAQYRLLTEGLHVNHLRLVIGTSMGGMHAWVWGETHPDFMDALLPLASAPVEIAGRNRIWRKMIMDAIRNDPAWNKGDYHEQPKLALETASDILMLVGRAPKDLHKQAPTRAAADELLQEFHARQKMDANDMLYALDASREYNPAPALAKIKAPLVAVNSADDEINPPELGILEREIKRVPRGRFVLLPTSPSTHGHGTHTYANSWKQELSKLLEESASSPH